MEVTVDIQGFRGVFNEFIVKELACIHVNTCVNGYQGLECILFTPPYAWDALPKKSKNINSWLTDHFHGISWEAGDTPYEEVKNVIKRITNNANTIYVKGLQKQMFVNEILDGSKPVINLEYFDCPKLTTLDLSFCHHHNDKHIFQNTCARENVENLKYWFLKNCTPCLERALKIFCHFLSSSQRDDETKILNELPNCFFPKKKYCYMCQALKKTQK